MYRRKRLLVNDNLKIVSFVKLFDSNRYKFKLILGKIECKFKNLQSLFDKQRLKVYKFINRFVFNQYLLNYMSKK
jgi:hypothetical protein